MTQLGFWVNAIEFGGTEQRVDCCDTFGAAVGVGEQTVAASDGNAAQSPFTSRVVDLDPAIAAVAQQRRTQVEGVLVRRRCVRFYEVYPQMISSRD